MVYIVENLQKGTLGKGRCMQVILTVTLNASVDRTVVVPSLTLGHRHRASEGIALAGGKGINVTRGLRALNVPVLKTALKAEPSLVSPNQHEAESAVGFDFIEGEDFLRGIGRLVELGAERACVTSPSGHSYVAVEGGVISASAPEVEALSTIGSGDAYLAGMLAGLLHRKVSPVEAVRLAAGCAAANAETLGAGVFEARRAEELAEEVRAEFLIGYTGQPSIFSYGQRQE